MNVYGFREGLVKWLVKKKLSMGKGRERYYWHNGHADRRTDTNTNSVATHQEHKIISNSVLGRKELTENIIQIDMNRVVCR